MRAIRGRCRCDGELDLVPQHDPVRRGGQRRQRPHECESDRGPRSLVDGRDRSRRGAVERVLPVGDVLRRQRAEDRCSASTSPAGGAGAWSASPAPAFDRIACASPQLCVAGGSGVAYGTTNPTGGASAWTLQFTDSAEIRDVGFVPFSVNGVACPSVTLCLAVDAIGVVYASTSPATAGSWSATGLEPPGPSVGPTGGNWRSVGDQPQRDRVHLDGVLHDGGQRYGRPSPRPPRAAAAGRAPRSA